MLDDKEHNTTVKRRADDKGFASSVERLVNYLYSKHLEENASPLFSPQLIVMNLEGEEDSDMNEPA